MIIVQSAVYDISMEIANTYSENCTEAKKLQCAMKPFSYKNTLIKKRTNYDTAKSVSFPYASDLTISLYEHVTSMEGVQPPRKIMTFLVTGINEAAERFGATPKVSLRFEIDSFGMVDLVSARASVDRVAKVNESGSNETEKVEEKVTLTIERQHAYPLPLNAEQFAQRKARLDALDLEEQKIFLRAKAKNTYESLIYAIRDWLNDDKNKRYVLSKTKDALIAFLAEEEEWLYKSDSAEMPEFENRTASLESKTKDMKLRKKEFEAFDSYTKKLKSFVSESMKRLSQMRENRTWISHEKFDSAEQKLKELDAWVAAKVKENKAASPAKDSPVLTQELVADRLNQIRAVFKALAAIERPKQAEKKNDTTEGTEKEKNTTEEKANGEGKKHAREEEGKHDATSDL